MSMDGAQKALHKASTSMSVERAMAAYLDTVALSRSPNTARTYRQALAAFRRSLARAGIEVGRLPARQASEDWIAAFAADLKQRSPATERLYLTATAGWFEYLAAEQLAEVNLARVHLLIRQRARRPGQRLPQFPRTAIEQVLEHSGKNAPSGDSTADHLRRLRDRAFLLTLADTGLRVHEACKLRRGDVDWDEAQALLVGKGDRQAIVRFSRRALRAVREYLKARSPLDGASGRALSALPLFARHDRGVGKRVRPITTTTGRTIVHEAVAAALGDDAVGTITPHSFRHYFVTTVLRGSGGNLKLAQELARHRSIAVTQRYAHLSDDELDRGYHEIFDSRRDDS
jgi:site-specific recombinase XerD